MRNLRFRLLSARDASGAAGRLMDAFADRDRVSCAYDAEAMVSSVAGRMVQAGLAGDRLRDACLDICDVLAASSAPLAVGILRAFAVAGPDSAVRDHARILADAAGRTAPAWTAELGQAIPGKCWAATDPFRESTVLVCEFSYPTRGNRHAVLARLDPVWHDAVSSLAVPFLEEQGSLDAGSAIGLARRLGAGSDPAVREAIWGETGFPENSPFYLAIQQMSAVPNSEPALRYGRYYFRQVSGDQVRFGFSPFNGVLAWSRILAGQERTIVANTSTTAQLNLSVVVDAALQVPPHRVCCTRTKDPVGPGSIATLPNAVVTQDDGTTSVGVVAVPVSLQPMEVQILSC